VKLPTQLRPIRVLELTSALQQIQHVDCDAPQIKAESHRAGTARSTLVAPQGWEE
jgi:hypothetical protein